MKYNVVISRTYTTGIVVDADNEDGVHEWLEENKETINHQELEQCNIVESWSHVELLAPSQNEAEELQDLVCHINQKLQEYRHVEDFVPNDLYKALEQMLAQSRAN
jgi:hypothetical protein